MSDLDSEKQVIAQNVSAVLISKKPDKAIYVPPGRRSKVDVNDGDGDKADTKYVFQPKKSGKSKLVSRNSDTKESLEVVLSSLRIDDDSDATQKWPVSTETKSAIPRSSSRSSLEAGIDYDKFLHVIELYAFPKDIETGDLQAELAGFEDSGFYLKWVDDTHCLAVFSSPTEAERALRQISGIMFKARPFKEASVDSKRKLARSPGDWAMPFKRRPPTTSATANRLISRHLGLKTPPSAEKLAQESREQLLLQEARARYEARRKAQKAIWEDESLDFPS